MTAIGRSPGSVAGSIAAGVEMAQRAVLHREGVPLAGTDAFVADVGRRQFRRDRLLGLEALPHAINDALGAEILGAVDPEGKLGRGAVLDHLLRKKILRPESQVAPAIV